MDLEVILKGALLGLAIAAPVGPIGVLCIRRTLAEGRLVGFISGLGAATADATYAAVGGFGIALVSEALVHEQAWLRLIGGAFLVYLGTTTFLARPVDQAAAATHRGLPGAYASTLVLTLSNPTTILSFAAVFAGVIPVTQTGTSVATQLVAGVFAGSTLWWLLLSTVLGMLRASLTPSRLRWLNRASGLLLLAFAAFVLF